MKLERMKFGPKLETSGLSWKVRAEIRKWPMKLESFDLTLKVSMKLESYHCSWKRQ